jgi:2'-hydroxyisoflavone reductase
VSVYADLDRRGLDESAPLHDPPPAEVEEITGETYGPLKVACEQAAEGAMPGRVLQVRPGLLVGPHDPTGRYPYWARRVAEGGPVLVPRTGQALQVLDARDLGAWVVANAEATTVGTVNLVGPPGAVGWSEAVQALVDAADGDAHLVEVDPADLIARGVRPWVDLPLWLGPEAGDGMMRVDDTLARSLGLTTRPIADTAADTLAWAAEAPAAAPGEDRPGLGREREAELLAELMG